MAATLAAAKLGIAVAHVEAGLRSGDRSMPEEINRIVTDALADCLFVSEPAGVNHLRREGHCDCSIHLVGNVMIDTLLDHLTPARSAHPVGEFGVEPHQYGMVTLHRPATVDMAETLGRVVEALVQISDRLPLLFAIHPRTSNRIDAFGLREQLGRATGLKQLPPLGYLPFLSLTSQAKLIITDSGGLQEEATVLGIPCLTMRRNTERPITVQQGTSTLVGDDTALLVELVDQVLSGTYKSGTCPELWDGRAAGRIARILAEV
jgi:UDP-N-acetylglucosamine 2-epimerase (non-hydrolysing)